MKKLGICICYAHRNYGSQLQSYATTVELKRRGIDFEIIRYKKKITPKLILKSLPKLFNPVFISDRVLVRYEKKLVMKTHPHLANDNNIRNKALADFSNSHFTKLSKIYYGYKQLCEESKKYYGIMVGSDQLWSPGGITSNFYNLMFADDKALKLSYAASFGVSEIEKKHVKLYNKFLSRMDYISVRENKGRELVEKLSSKTATVVVDPVLLLTADQWLNEIPNKKLYKEKYIFAYFLGKSQKFRNEVTKFAKSKNLKIVTEHHMDSYNKSDNGFGDYAPFNIGPAEFVNLIRNAEYIFTDSFHGSVFSIIYKKQFMVFDRYANDSICSKNSRIDSLCENYCLSDRRYDGDICKIDNKINFDVVLEKVENHRKASLNYLDNALKSFKEEKYD